MRICWPFTSGTEQSRLRDEPDAKSKHIAVLVNFMDFVLHGDLGANTR
jgi:hypothetical protein